MVKWFRRAAVVLFGFLAGSCGNGNMEPAEYGMPHARFTLAGQVVSASDQLPIPGIQISFQDRPVFSNEDGNWSIDSPDFFPPGSDDTIYLQIRDTDGIENGLFHDKEITVSLTRIEEGSGTWNHGSYEATGITIELDPAEEDE